MLHHSDLKLFVFDVTISEIESRNEVIVRLYLMAFIFFIVLLKFEGHYKNRVTTLVNDDSYEFPLHQPL